jgi:hypothetical protein
MKTTRALALILVAALVGCGSVSGGRDPDASLDGTPPDIDAGVDAPVAMVIGNVVDLGAAGGRVTGGGLTFDVQVGHPFSQQQATGGGLTFEGSAAVKP